MIYGFIGYSSIILMSLAGLEMDGMKVEAEREIPVTMQGHRFMPCDGSNFAEHTPGCCRKAQRR